MDKWEQLAKAFHADNYKLSEYSDYDVWKRNSNFTMRFVDQGVQLPDVTTKRHRLVEGVEAVAGFFKDFAGEIVFPSHMDTSNVTDMEAMFSGTAKANPDVSNWDVSNVENMEAMFFASKMANPNVSNWNVSNVKNMNSMFEYSKLANPDVSNWNVSNVTSFVTMFADSKKANPDVSNWNMSSAKDISGMFANASMARPDVSRWNVSNVEIADKMFLLSKVESLDLSGWRPSKLTSMKSMFQSSIIKHLDLGNWNVQDVEAGDAFSHIEALRSLRFKGLKNVELKDSMESDYEVRLDGVVKEASQSKSSPYRCEDNGAYYMKTPNAEVVNVTLKFKKDGQELQNSPTIFVSEKNKTYTDSDLFQKADMEVKRLYEPKTPAASKTVGETDVAFEGGSEIFHGKI